MLTPPPPWIIINNIVIIKDMISWVIHFMYSILMGYMCLLGTAQHFRFLNKIGLCHPLFPIPHKFLSAGYLLFITATAKNQLHKDRTSWKEMWCDLMLKLNYPEVKFTQYLTANEYHCFLWVFETLLPHSCACAVAPQDATLHNMETFFGNNPSSILPFCLALNTLYFVFELLLCTGLTSATRSVAPWSSETMSCTCPSTETNTACMQKMCNSSLLNE